MKVLYITHYSSMYGANKSLVNMINELRVLGVEPFVVCPSKGDLEKVLENDNIPYKIIPFKNWVSENKNPIKSWAKFILNYFYSYKLSRMVKATGISIIHSNSSATQVGAIAAKLAFVKHVWHIREFLQEDYNLEFEVGYSKAVRLINNYSDAIILISSKIKEKYESDLDNNKMKMIYNGVPRYSEIQDTHRELDLTDNKRLSLLLVGLIVKQKGQEEAIFAVQYLLKEKGVKCNLNIVGDGPYKEYLENLTAQLGLEGIVKFWGYQRDVTKFMWENDIALMCSTNEAFGRTTIEAMLAGLPVIGANAGATSEIVVDNYTGLLYESGNFIDLAEKINHLVENPNKLLIFGKAGKERALKYFTSEINAKNIFETYISL